MKFILARMLNFALKRGLTLLGVYLMEKGWAEGASWDAFVVAAVPILVDFALHAYDRLNALEKEQAQAKVVKFVQRISTTTIE